MMVLESFLIQEKLWWKLSKCAKKFNGVDMKNSSYVSNKKHHIYILGKSSTQGLQYGATIYAEHDYAKVNGSLLNVKFVLLVHYNGYNSYLFINGVQQFKFKAMSSLNLKS